jgi:hypothetical protein
MMGRLPIMEIINYIFSFLRIETQIVLVSELGVSGKGMPLIIDICKSLGASQFLVQSSALTHYDSIQLMKSWIISTTNAVSSLAILPD